MHEVAHGNHRVRLATAVGELKLANRFVIFSSQPQDDLTH